MVESRVGEVIVVLLTAYVYITDGLCKHRYLLI